ncbi:hypothetical protein HYV44_02290 [Candidatus Microgenomates bacterium]|nr:hypothetical protein [Candidatus Microgenomates bacterium]
MKEQTFVTVAGTIFAIVGVLHLIRAALSWELLIADWALPLWASWVGGIVLVILAYNAFTAKK